MSQTPSEDSPGGRKDAPPVAPATESGLAAVERTFLRLTFWQTLLSVAGVFTGAVALYAALNESQAVREQTAASVWPYVQLMMDDRGDGESAYFALSLTNVGVGPARMRGVRIEFNGQFWNGWEALASELLGEPTSTGAEFGKSSVSRRVLAPGEAVTAFQTGDLKLATLMRSAVYSDKAAIAYCYCSIFDQCWLLDSSALGSDSEPREVEKCPDFGSEAFLD